MMSWDLIVTVTIIAGASLYLIRKFSRSKKDGACGCGSEGGCCGGDRNGSSSHCGDRHT